MQTSTTQPWALIPKVEPSDSLIQSVGGHWLIASLLAQRGHTTPEAAAAFLDPTQYRPADPKRLYGVATAAAILAVDIATRPSPMGPRVRRRR